MIDVLNGDAEIETTPGSCEVLEGELVGVLVGRIKTEVVIVGEETVAEVDVTDDNLLLAARAEETNNFVKFPEDIEASRYLD